MKNILTIAGSDPSGGAGIQADLLTFSDFKLHGLSAVTALTAQDSRKVFSVNPVTALMLKRQVSSVAKRFKVDAVKIGMLATEENVKAVISLIKKYNFTKVVCDPVFRSTSGFPLLTKAGIKAMAKLLPLVTILTPNIDEAEVLSGLKIKSLKDMEVSAVKIHTLGPRFVLIKGGHLRGRPVDVLYDGKKFTHFEGKRIKGTRHGTGCVLSSAIAAGIAKEWSMTRAVKEARSYTEKYIKTA